MRCSWEGQPPHHKVKKAIFIGQVMNVVSVEVHRPIGALSLALVRSPLVFSFMLLPLSFIFLSAPRVIRSSHHSLSLSSSCFLPSASNRLSHRIYCNWLYLSFSPLLPLSLISFLHVSLSSSSQQISCCRPELKVTCWLGQGLQHRTWVLPLLPARVLCCSQWSCLSASLPACWPTAAGLSSQNRWIPPTCRPCYSLYSSLAPYRCHLKCSFPNLLSFLTAWRQ